MPEFRNTIKDRGLHLSQITFVYNPREQKWKANITVGFNGVPRPIKKQVDAPPEVVSLLESVYKDAMSRVTQEDIDRHMGNV